MERWNSGEDHGGVTVDELRTLLDETRQVAQLLTSVLEDEAGTGAGDEKQRAVGAPLQGIGATPEGTSGHGVRSPAETGVASEASLPSVTRPLDHAEAWAALEIRYRPVVLELLTAAEWTPEAFTAVVRSHGLFPAGTLDVVNEWAEEQFGDLLLEEGDPLLVHRDLLGGAPFKE